MRYNIREMQLDDTRLMIRYFLEADVEYLDGMGVDPEKLPSESTWYELLKEDFDRPLRQKQFYYLVWEADEVPIGHCNINKIAFGELAYMHLHIWNADNRRGGTATQLLKPSIAQFFERFELRELFCEPYALNPGPNKTLPKLGFRLVKTYETTPGWINTHQPVNLWVLDRATAQGATVISLEKAFAKLSFVANRKPESTDEELQDAFAELAPYRDGGIFIGHYAGHSEWERHSHGDEMVFVLEGETTLFLLGEDGEVAHKLHTGELLVVPENTWHRFETPKGVKIMTVTPQPTDHSVRHPHDQQPQD